MTSNQMSDKSSRNSIGSLIITPLGVTFVVLKLCGVIDWSWWWVTLPFWGGAAVAILFGLCVAILYGGAAIAMFSTSRSSK